MRTIRSIGLLLLLSTNILVSQVSDTVRFRPPRIYHHPPRKLNYDQFDRLECSVDPGSHELRGVFIALRNSEDRSYSEYPMHSEKGIYTLRIIPEMVRSDTLRYYIRAEFADFAVVAYPEKNPTENPLRVPIEEPRIIAKKIPVERYEKIFCDLGRDIDNIQSVTIYTRWNTSRYYHKSPMTLSAGRFQYSIDPPSRKEKYLYYYIIVTYTDLATIYYPSEQEITIPVRVYHGRRL